MIHCRATIALTALSLLHAAAAEPVVDSQELPRLPPVEAKDALKTFKVRPGFASNSSLRNRSSAIPRVVLMTPTTASANTPCASLKSSSA